MYYDKEGKKISREVSIKLWEDINYRRIAKEKLSNGAVISTVWLGYYSDDEPTVFETLVSNLDEDFQVNYFSLQEAIDGHEKIKEICSECLPRSETLSQDGIYVIYKEDESLEEGENIEIYHGQLYLNKEAADKIAEALSTIEGVNYIVGTLEHFIDLHSENCYDKGAADSMDEF